MSSSLDQSRVFSLVPIQFYSLVDRSYLYGLLSTTSELIFSILPLEAAATGPAFTLILQLNVKIERSKDRLIQMMKSNSSLTI